ncbi:aminotransferase class I/II-fold pyridoxal phosphate-dependent enzyme [Prochlorococcus sp. MIT 1341]|uniref:methionine gamma-lyase family protein n=1 Tax=Prochlorococcus sp. MIT 1341 TaxID=3096221 RepID=UPI002A7490CF|nr:aminotransferase class I/II-fold pyridoxal phosphate-dependent enzyme [Prochlorococcus sp. MIT 1341]
MQKLPSNELNEHLIEAWANNEIASAFKRIESSVSAKTTCVMGHLEKVLDAFSSERIGTQHFSSFTGYGHGDENREAIDRVFARVLGAEKAAIRLQLVSGTHAICSALFGVLRPGDELLCITGQPYETLEAVIGTRGKGQGSLIDFGVSYEELNLRNDGTVDLEELDKALETPRKMILIQRSCGYSWRPSLRIDSIKVLCEKIHKKQPKCVCFVDNCYGEFVEDKEPTEVGADLIAGSLIKNLGGTITPTGGYIAGKTDLVEQACYRLTSPGIGSKGGSGFDLYRLVLQGLFLAPQMVSEALIGAELIAEVFSSLGFDVNPTSGQNRGDIIQAVCLKSEEALTVVCKAFQASSPIGSYLDPIPGEMPGYSNDLLMAGGTFIDGSTSEFSADAPLKPPFNLYIQGGTHHTHVKIALRRALIALIRAKLISFPTTN